MTNIKVVANQLLEPIVNFANFPKPGSSTQKDRHECIMVALAELIFISGAEHGCHLWAFYKLSIKTLFSAQPQLCGRFLVAPTASAICLFAAAQLRTL